MAGFGEQLQAAAPMFTGIGSQLSGRDPMGIARGMALMSAKQESDKRKAAIDNMLSGMGISGPQKDMLSTLPPELQQQWILQQMAPKPRNIQIVNGQAVDMDTMQVVGDFRTPGAPVPSLADMGMGGPVATNDEFVAQMWPHALRVSQATGLDPRLVVAQSAQETGWGKHAPNNNYFGIKSHGRPGGATLATKEVYGGQPVAENASFRTYGGMGQSADDYAAFLQQNPRYGEMLSAQGLDAQLEALGRSGYATDPNYAASVGRIARSITPVGGVPGLQASGPDAELAGINQRIQRFEQASALGYDVSRYQPMYERLLKDRDALLARQQEAAKAAAGPGFDTDLANTYRDDMRTEPALTLFADVQSGFDAIEQFYQAPGAVSDYALAVAFAKIVDPGSVAREGEVAAVSGAAGAYPAFEQALKNAITREGKMPPEMRKEIADLGAKLYAKKADRASTVLESYQRRAERAKIPFDEIWSNGPIRTLPDDWVSTVDVLPNAVDRFTPQPPVVAEQPQPAPTPAPAMSIPGKDDVQAAIDSLTPVQKKTFGRLRTPSAKLDYLLKLGKL